MEKSIETKISSWLSWSKVNVTSFVRRERSIDPVNDPAIIPEKTSSDLCFGRQQGSVDGGLSASKQKVNVMSHCHAIVTFQ